MHVHASCREPALRKNHAATYRDENGLSPFPSYTHRLTTGLAAGRRLTRELPLGHAAQPWRRCKHAAPPACPAARAQDPLMGLVPPLTRRPRPRASRPRAAAR